MNLQRVTLLKLCLLSWLFYLLNVSYLSHPKTFLRLNSTVKIYYCTLPLSLRGLLPVSVHTLSKKWLLCTGWDQTLPPPSLLQNLVLVKTSTTSLVPPVPHLCKPFVQLMLPFKLAMKSSPLHEELSIWCPAVSNSVLVTNRCDIWRRLTRKKTRVFRRDTLGVRIVGKCVKVQSLTIAHAWVRKREKLCRQWKPPPTFIKEAKRSHFGTTK